MTSLVTQVPSSETNPTVHTYRNTFNIRQHRCVLKSKENTLKVKCNKALKRKLKKYKLRQDGKEDQDVLDVSDILVTSLTIKSPNNQRDTSEFKELRPKNYLFKMVRDKQIIKDTESSDVATNKHNNSKNDSQELFNGNQEKKQANAFQLLMESRNKSLGSNSPGKEKSVDETEIQEINDKKSVKAKRLLVLQKMAEAKGSIKKKETDEYQEKFIKRKMEKRAEKLKNMLLNHEPKSAKADKDTNCSSVKGIKTNPIILNNVETVNISNCAAKQTKSLQLVNMFNDTDDQIKSNKKQINLADEEFLKKLSPSLKKKENMLCYFQKIAKESESPPTNSENNDVIIKVKLLKPKKRKKKKLSLNRDISSVNDDNENSQINRESEVIKDFTDEILKRSDRQKRKRNLRADTPSKDGVEKPDAILVSDERPKRSVKRPVKYIDDIFLSSSDEELHIFTPRKKKHTENKTISNIPKSTTDLNSGNSAKITRSDKKNGHQKNPVKLAPIFGTKQQDLAAIEAKQKFLQSGVPEKLKKIISQQQAKTTALPHFPVVVHVQQKVTANDEPLIHKQTCNSVNILEFKFELRQDDEEIDSTSWKESSFKKLLNLSEPPCNSKAKPQINKNVNNILQNMKQLRPKFPVYRTYRSLRDKKKGDFKDNNYLDIDNSIEVLNGVMDVNNENPDQLSWTDKYKASSTNQIIGNFESIKELRKWLVMWNENEFKPKNNTAVDSDSSDFYQSDTDSRDSLRNGNNLLILTGPVGSGKTSSVYAVAAELAIKVIEVNASNKRTGKIMLQDLQEATQSHKVNRGASNSENSQKSQEVLELDLPKKVKNRGRPKKNVEKLLKKVESKIKGEVLSGASASQEITRTDSSLILIDDADIVFDQDDGFCSAIVQLVQSSKRPVILVTSSLECPHLQRFRLHSKILQMHPFLPRMLGTWLDIMCLADNGVCCPGAGAKILNYFKGDIRKTINCLQFYASAQSQDHLDEEVASQSSDGFRPSIDDEKSSMSWADREDIEETNIIESSASVSEWNYIWKYFICKQSYLLQFQYPLELFNIWWSLPHLLNTITYSDRKSNEDKVINKNKSDDIIKLELLANAMDSVSIAEYLSHSKPDTNVNIASQPWFSSESHSVSEQENFDDFTKVHEVNDEISYELVNKSIREAQHSCGSNRRTDLVFPGITMQRERDRVVSRHNNLTSYLNPSAVLDRKALALDYWASCRTICKIEQTKTENKSRRKNRFCHYLKSLNVLCTSNMFDNLGDSLCFSEKSEFNFNEF